MLKKKAEIIQTETRLKYKNLIKLNSGSFKRLLM